MSQNILERLKTRFPDAVSDTHNFRGDETALIRRENLLEVMRWLKHECGFEMLMDLTAVDYLGEELRFEVVYHLKSIFRRYRLRIKVRVPEGDPSVDSLVSLWKGANWYERECHEFYGIKFKGHPDLRPLLLYPEFKGYPLRKDYPHNKRQPRIPLIKPETR
jgi:NADH-quinone oxidoreductase subunit C